MNIYLMFTQATSVNKLLELHLWRINVGNSRILLTFHTMISSLIKLRYNYITNFTNNVVHRLIGCIQKNTLNPEGVVEGTRGGLLLKLL